MSAYSSHSNPCGSCGGTDGKCRSANSTAFPGRPAYFCAHALDPDVELPDGARVLQEGIGGPGGALVALLDPSAAPRTAFRDRSAKENRAAGDLEHLDLDDERALDLFDWLQRYAADGSYNARARADAETWAESKGIDLDGSLYAPAFRGPDFDQLLEHLESARPGNLKPGSYRERFRSLAGATSLEFFHDEDGRPHGLRATFPGAKVKSKNPKGGAPRLHYAPGWRDALQQSGDLHICEASRKANVGSERTAGAWVGLNGLSAGKAKTEQLERLVREQRPRRVVLWLDHGDTLDPREHKDVHKRDATRVQMVALMQLQRVAHAVGSEFRVATWPVDGPDAKGPDDYLQSIGWTGPSYPPSVEFLDLDAWLALLPWQHEKAKADALARLRTALQQVEPAPLVHPPTRPTVRTIDEARATTAQIVAEHDFKRSLAFTGDPGLGKTTAASTVLMQRAAELGGIVVLALPTRDLVREKLASLDRLRTDLGIAPDLELRTYLGRIRKEGERPRAEPGDFHCDEQERVRHFSDEGRTPCAGCPLKAECEATEGRFLADAAALREDLGFAVAGGSPVFVVTTLAALGNMVEGQGEVSLPASAVLVLDDPPPLLGLMRTFAFSRTVLGAYAEAADQFAAGGRKALLDTWRRYKDADIERAVVTAKLALDAAGDLSEAKRAAAQFRKTTGWSASLVFRTSSKSTDAEVLDVEIGKAWRAHKSDPDRKHPINRLKSYARQAQGCPFPIVARFAADMADAIQRSRRQHSEPIHSLATKLEPDVRAALATGELHAPPSAYGPPAWPWEQIDGSENLPALLRTFRRILRETIERAAPLRTRGIGAENERIEVHCANAEMIARARAGRLLWLSVAQPPRQVLEALGAVREYVDSEAPYEVRIQLCLDKPDDGRTGDPGSHSLGRGEFADDVVTRFASGLAERCGRPEGLDVDWMLPHLPPQQAEVLAQAEQAFGSFAAVLAKADRQHLGDPEWCGSYGADHASSDRFQGRRVLVVRRHVPPYAEAEREAEVARRILGLRRPDEAPEDAQLAPLKRHGRHLELHGLDLRIRLGEDANSEPRRWQGCDAAPVSTLELTDELARDFQHAAESHSQLNAAGRSRPFLATPTRPKLTISLAGRPVPGQRIDAVLDLRDAWREWEIPGALPSQGSLQLGRSLRHAETAEARDRRDTALRGLMARTGGSASDADAERALKAAGLAPKLTRVIKTELAQLRAEYGSEDEMARLWKSVLEALSEGGPTSCGQGIEEPMANAHELGPRLPSSPQLRDFLTAQAEDDGSKPPSLSTLKSHLAAVRKQLGADADTRLQPPSIKHASGRRTRLAVLRAACALLGVDVVEHQSAERPAPLEQPLPAPTPVEAAPSAQDHADEQPTHETTMPLEAPEPEHDPLPHRTLQPQARSAMHEPGESGVTNRYGAQPQEAHEAQSGAENAEAAPASSTPPAQPDKPAVAGQTAGPRALPAAQQVPPGVAHVAWRGTAPQPRPWPGQGLVEAEGAPLASALEQLDRVRSWTELACADLAVRDLDRMAEVWIRSLVPPRSDSPGPPLGSEARTDAEARALEGFLRGTERLGAAAARIGRQSWYQPSTAVYVAPRDAVRDLLAAEPVPPSLHDWLVSLLDAELEHPAPPRPELFEALGAVVAAAHGYDVGEESALLDFDDRERQIMSRDPAGAQWMTERRSPVGESDRLPESQVRRPIRYRVRMDRRGQPKLGPARLHSEARLGSTLQPPHGDWGLVFEPLEDDFDVTRRTQAARIRSRQRELCAHVAKWAAVSEEEAAADPLFDEYSLVHDSIPWTPCRSAAVTAARKFCEGSMRYEQLDFRERSALELAVMPGHDCPVEIEPEAWEHAVQYVEGKIAEWALDAPPGVASKIVPRWVGATEIGARKELLDAAGMHLPVRWAKRCPDVPIALLGKTQQERDDRLMDALEASSQLERATINLIDEGLRLGVLKPQIASEVA